MPTNSCPRVRPLVRPLVLLVFAVLRVGETFAAEPADFSRDILPLLSEKCLSCHGPDESHRKADLRLDQRESAITPRAGGAAIVPLHPEKSELLRRVRSSDPEEVMPTPKSHKTPLKPEEIALLSRWIAEGAPWGTHWAFSPPKRPALPGVTVGVVGREAPAHPVDAFVQAKLAAVRLQPAARAARHTLLRRVSFDLTGLPPTLSELDAFLGDTSANAWEKLVDRLLASPHFGERMAMWWLDAARYADTDGFQADSTRTNWPWRDWVLGAFNNNLPFDQFTLQQFAGDLLPNASADHILATCFHRNHMTNGEGGRDPEESRVDYVIDRVNSIGTVWLGLTLACTQCHSHKFDPISQADYYSLSAFFNSIDETGAAGSGAKPFLELQSPHVSGALAAAERLVAEAKQTEASAREGAHPHFEAVLPEMLQRAGRDFREWHPLRAERLLSAEGTVLTQDNDGIVQASGPAPNQDDYRFVARIPVARLTGIRLEVLPQISPASGGLSRGKSGEFILTDVKVQVGQPGKTEIRDLKLAAAYADFSADKKTNGGYGEIKDTLDDDPRNGWSTKGSPQNTPHIAVFRLAEAYHPAPGEELHVELRQRSTLGDANLARLRLSVTDQPGESVAGIHPGPLAALAASGATTPEEIPAPLRKRLQTLFLEDHPPFLDARSALARANDQLNETKAAAGKLKVMVLSERKEPRQTFVLVRGVWNKFGEEVKPDVPASIAPWPADQPRTRLGLARWLVSRDNPLTARVIVNQLWQLLFGEGLQRTPEDFGLQGYRPMHGELLDWLAVEFMESGWDVKKMLRLLATSETYRQSSACSEDLLARDPHNKLLARGARFRLPSWMLRDAALRASGLLETSVGGPPVRPYQPQGVWEELFMGRFKYDPSIGPAQHKRTLYAFWRRAIAPTFLFDSAQRRVCEVRTHRTNTPLQALTLLNDEGYREAARVLGTASLTAASTPEDRIRWLMRSILSREPRAAELPPLLQTLATARSHYQGAPRDARSVLQAGQSPPPPQDRLPEAAAYGLVAGLLLNLDEALSHE